MASSGNSPKITFSNLNKRRLLSFNADNSSHPQLRFRIPNSVKSDIQPESRQVNRQVNRQVTNVQPSRQQDNKNTPLKMDDQLSFQINPFHLTQSNIVKYQQQYKEKGYVAVPNFIFRDHASQIYHFLNNGIPEHWWSTAVHPGKEQKIFVLNGKHTQTIEDKKKFPLEEFGKAHFSYTFDRTINNHYKNCTCYMCQFTQFIRTEDFLKNIAMITGENVTSNYTLFASRYTSGDYLSIHTDQGNGKIAFVYNLTAHWKPQYGGCLTMLEDDNYTIKKTFVPGFNTLLMFKVKPGGTPHFVSHVAPGVNGKRLSITGWFE